MHPVSHMSLSLLNPILKDRYGEWERIPSAISREEKDPTMMMPHYAKSLPLCDVQLCFGGGCF